MNFKLRTSPAFQVPGPLPFRWQRHKGLYCQGLNESIRWAEAGGVLAFEPQWGAEISATGKTGVLEDSQSEGTGDERAT